MCRWRRMRRDDFEEGTEGGDSTLPVACMNGTRYSIRLSAKALPLVQLGKAKCVNAVRLVARPQCASPQIWSCQSLFDRLTIRFGSVQSVAADARARTEAKLNFPNYSLVPLDTMIGLLMLC